MAAVGTLSKFFNVLLFYGIFALYKELRGSFIVIIHGVATSWSDGYSPTSFRNEFPGRLNAKVLSDRMNACCAATFLQNCAGRMHISHLEEKCRCMQKMYSVSKWEKMQETVLTGVWMVVCAVKCVSVSGVAAT